MADEARSRQQYVDVVVTEGGGNLRSAQEYIDAVVAGNPQLQNAQLYIDLVVNPTFNNTARSQQLYIDIVMPFHPDPPDGYAYLGLPAIQRT